MHLQVIPGYRHAYRLAVLVAVLGVAACQAPAPRPGVTPEATFERAARLAEDGRTADAAALFDRAAGQASGAEASRLHLRAAESWLQAGYIERAGESFRRIDAHELDMRYRMRVQMLGAAFALEQNRPADALQRLSFRLDELDPPRHAEALGMRADAYLALDRPRRAIEDLVRRGDLLEDDEYKDDNHQRIWEAVHRLGDTQTEDDTQLAGWIELAELRRRAWQDPWAFEDALENWKRRFPGHPAAERFIPRLADEREQLVGAARNIALILPLDSRFAGAAEAVRDGFLSAYYRLPDAAQRPTVRVYDDRGDPETAVALYRQAVQDGADIVIGPLQRESVAAVARAAPLPVPVLALNALDPGQPGTGNLYQFGLTPEDEARQVAERLAQESRLRGIALVPDNDLGLRLLRAFSDRFKELGGELLDTRLFDPQAQDHAGPITQSLAIDESRARHRVLRMVLNADVRAQPRRRQDAEFVFLVGTPQQGRTIRPQLRFHHASDLPVYATSHVFTGVPDPAADSDLNGVTFVDMPWTVAPSRSAHEVKAALAAQLGGAWERQVRLYALGFDAYRLAPVLLRNPEMLAEPVPAGTGALWLDEQGRIRRHLTWSQFQGGHARALPAPAEPPLIETPVSEFTGQ